MTKRYSIAEARASLPTIVDEVEAGNEIELTRRGEPVAVVVSRPAYNRLTERRSRFADAYRSFLERYRLEEVGIDESVFDVIRESASARDVDL